LAIGDEYVVVGASAIAFGTERLKSNGNIVVLNRNYDLTGEIYIKGSGGTSETRMLGLDYGLSEISFPEILSDALARMDRM